MSSNVIQTRTILVIDDSPMMRKFLRAMLKKNFEVHEVASVVEGLEWVYFHAKPDLVILDLNMKEMNGYEFLGRMQADPALIDLAVLVLSGEKKSEERIKCLEMGAKDYVVKPFNPKELLLRIEKLLSDQKDTANLDQLN